MAISLNSSALVTVFGGSGFVGRYVVQELAKTGCRIRVAARRPGRAFHLQPLGGVGQIHAVQANLRDDASVRRAVEGADAVVNLAGILQVGGKQSFHAVHSEGAGRVAHMAVDAGARTIVHMSAIGADRSSKSAYARSKAEGEELVSQAFPDAVILRPSIIFGTEDEFFNRFAAMARISPVMPLIGGGKTRFQPVYVGDVAQAVIASLDGRARPGVPYELGGPRVYTFREIFDLIAKYTQRDRSYVPVPFFMAKLQAFFLQMLPNAPVTVDQLRMLQSDNVVSQQAVDEVRTLADLGVAASAVEAIVPQYLVRFCPKGEFSLRSV